MRDFIKRAAALLFAAIIMTTVLPYGVGISAYAAEEKWDRSVDWNKRGSEFSVDKETYYGDSGYSIKITNKEYNIAYVEKTFRVKKNTTYRATVMAKFSGYSQPSDAVLEFSGASIGKSTTYEISNCYNGSKWEKLSFVFNSGSEDTYTLSLNNGLWNTQCKGTAWFSDFKLEEFNTWDKAHQSKTDSRTEFDIDRETYYGDSGYSVRITNNKDNMAFVEKVFKVKKNTRYRATVMAKYKGYKQTEEVVNRISGASLGQTLTYNTSNCYNGSKWEKLTYEFYSGDESTYSLSLNNGLWNTKCSGTAWFSDFRLEEYTGEPGNEWNILTVVFKNVKVPVTFNGKSFTYKASLTDTDVKYLKGVVENMYTDIPLLSDGLWKIKSIDTVTAGGTITELGDYIRDNEEENYHIKGYSLDINAPCVSEQLDRILEKAEKKNGKKYNQIILISPLTDIAGGWLGLGGGTYNGARICQLNYKSGTESFGITGDNYFESAFVHEMLHGVEAISRDVLKAPTENLHANVLHYKKYYPMHDLKGWDNYGTWHSDYMRKATPKKTGVDPRAFLSYNDNNYKVVYGSKTSRIKHSSKDVAALEISKPKNQVYSGKAKKLALTVKDGGKTLKEGTDYTLTYYNNKNIGLGAVVVNGKGKYSGKYAQTFGIIPQKPVLTVKKSNGKYNLYWDKVKNAGGYEVFYSSDGGKTFKSSGNTKKTSCVLKLDTNGEYIFKIRAYKTIYPQNFYSLYSDEVKL